MRNPTKLAIALAVLGGVAAIVSLGENVTIFDIALGAAINFAIGYGIGSLIWRKSKESDTSSAAASTPRPASEPRLDPPDIPARHVGAASPTPSEIAESLRRIKALRDEGILTEAEYQAKRQSLADRL